MQTWGSEGDVQPFLALAGGLAQQGHQVRLLVTDFTQRDHSAVADRLGFSVENIGDDKLPELDALGREIFAMRDPVRQLQRVVEHWFDPAVEAVLAGARQLCSASDVVVGHMALHPLRIAAAQAGVPLATLTFAPAGMPSAYCAPHGMPDLGRWLNPLWWQLARALMNRAFLPRINDLRRREGLAPDTDVLLQSWVSDWLNLLAVSPALCARQPDWGAQHQVCGFLNPPAPDVPDQVRHDLDAFLSSGAPPVYFTFGSMLPPDLAYLQEVADIWFAAVRQLGCRAIFQLPWDDAGVFAQDPRVFTLKRAAHATVFPRCAMVVHHGGAGTTQASLLAGRPAVIVAHIADQFYWGSRLESLGVAGPSQTRRTLRAAPLARAIAQVLAAPRMAERAAALGRAMSAENGVAAAAKSIEEKMNQRRSLSPRGEG